MKLTLDKSARSAVAVCPCGWRDVATAPGPVLRAAADHYAAAHPELVAAEGRLRVRAAGATRR